MHILSIPMWTGSHDNYAYLVVDENTKDAMIIDPANPPEVLPVLKEEIEKGKVNLKGVVNTHHHYDHAGGNKEILKEFPSIGILGGKDCDSVTHKLKDGETFKIGSGIDVKALHTPCHTQDSICYYVEDKEKDQRVVFTGDTLFVAGCGRFFEGTAEEMHRALNEVLASLPDDTRVYPGHEYTKSNIKFGASIVQDDHVGNLIRFCEENDRTEGKFTVGDERKHNVFMRVNDPAVQSTVGETDPVQVMQKLREMKNSFM